MPRGSHSFKFQLKIVYTLPQEQLSEKINIDPKHLSRIEVGKSYLSLDTLEKIARALDVEIKELFEFIHHTTTKELNKNINDLLKKTDDESLRLILKIVRAIVC